LKAVAPHERDLNPTVPADVSAHIWSTFKFLAIHEAVKGFACLLETPA